MSVAPATISLLSLPDELLIPICEEVGSQPALCSQIRVNRTFSNITDRYTYTTIKDAPFPHRFTATLVAFKANPDRLSWVRRRSIRYSVDYNSAMCRANSRLVGSILCRLPNLYNLETRLPRWTVRPTLRLRSETYFTPGEVKELRTVFRRERIPNTINHVTKGFMRCSRYISLYFHFQLTSIDTLDALAFTVGSRSLYYPC
jgi:hypothetical protein